MDNFSHVPTSLHWSFFNTHNVEELKFLILSFFFNVVEKVNYAFGIEIIYKVPLFDLAFSSISTLIIYYEKKIIRVI